MHDDQALWHPSPTRIKKAKMTQLAAYVGVLSEDQILADPLSAYRIFHQWSLDHLEEFWSKTSEFVGIHWSKVPDPAVTMFPRNSLMLGHKWFPGAQLNYAENIFLGLQSSPFKESLVVGICEGADKKIWSEAKLRQETRACQLALRQFGVKKGSRVCGVLSNVPESLVAMLGVTSLGGIWSSCSPDFGAEGVYDRFFALEPEVLFVTKRYFYQGKEFSTSPMIDELLLRLTCVKHLIWIDHLEDSEPQKESHQKPPFIYNMQAQDTVKQWSYKELVSLGRGQQEDQAELFFEPMAPHDPVFILFSSGTTGLPKCIVHSVLGTLLQHKKEHVLHCDMGPGDRLFYFTTCGWMMWNWQVSALASGVSLLMYDGAVQAKYPHLASGIRSAGLWDLVEDENVTVFGTSPKYLSFSMSEGLRPIELRLKNLRSILSTGSPLSPEHSRWIYREVATDVHLASISGGTDILSCFMLGNPWTPVFAGEIQGPGLGMAVEAWDEDGHAVVGHKGELVCTKPFPSMPLGFWKDFEDKKYQEAYFNHYPGREVWHHGDFIEVTPRGSIIVYGRSDATLNPGGIRIGSAEIYRQVENFSGVLDSLIVSVKEKDDAPMALFVKLTSKSLWNQEFEKKLRLYIRHSLSPRHNPKWVFAIGDIPYTRSGKKMELLVTQILAGEYPKNIGSCANPDCIEEYQALRPMIYK